MVHVLHYSDSLEEGIKTSLAAGLPRGPTLPRCAYWSVFSPLLVAGCLLWKLLPWATARGDLFPRPSLSACKKNYSSSTLTHNTPDVKGNPNPIALFYSETHFVSTCWNRKGNEACDQWRILRWDGIVGFTKGFRSLDILLFFWGVKKPLNTSCF